MFKCQSLSVYFIIWHLFLSDFLPFLFSCSDMTSGVIGLSCNPEVMFFYLVNEKQLVGSV